MRRPIGIDGRGERHGPTDVSCFVQTTAFRFALLLALGGCEPYEPDGPAPVMPAAPVAPAVIVVQSPNTAATPLPSKIERPEAASPPPTPAPPKKTRGPEDDTAELFACTEPGACKDVEARAKRLVATSWHCAESDITATARDTKGLSVHATSMTMTAEGTVEVHIKPGVKGTGFDVEGCNHVGTVACVPAHRTIHTADKTYDKVDDTVCLWAE